MVVHHLRLKVGIVALGPGTSMSHNSRTLPYDTHEWVYTGGGQIYEYWWYGFGSGGAFTLAGPGGTFSGYFNQGSGTSFQADTGPQVQSFDVALTYTGPVSYTHMKLPTN